MVDYDVMVRQIRRGVWEWQEEHGPDLHAEEPRMSATRGNTAVSFYTTGLKRESFLDIVDIINSHYAQISKLGRFLTSDYHLEASVGPGFLKDDNGTTHIFVDYRTWRQGTAEQVGEVKIERQGEFAQADVNCTLAIWRALAGKSTKINPAKRLRDLGITVYADNTGYTWDRLAGYERVKQDLIDTIVLPYQHPEMYDAISQQTKGTPADPIRAILLFGPPGTGKTTAARIIAGECKTPLVYIPVETIMSMWYGQSEQRLAEAFRQSGKLDRSIVFIDEIDTLAASRGKDMHEATRRILSVLLRQMQGIERKRNVMTLGSTNRKEDLDSALLSRFNRQIEFPAPNEQERKGIFSLYARHLTDDQIMTLAKKTDGLCGRDIEDICNDAERMWARRLIASGKEPSAPSGMVYLEAAGKSRPGGE